MASFGEASDVEKLSPEPTCKDKGRSEFNAEFTTASSASTDSGAEELPGGGKTFQRCQEDFVCGHCGHAERGDGYRRSPNTPTLAAATLVLTYVTTLRYTNHCSQCLWSKHVDVNPGDRASLCQGLMPAVLVDTKKGHYRFLQRCEV